MPFNDHSRRKFLQRTAQAGIILTAGSLTGLPLLASGTAGITPNRPPLYDTGFDQQKLPYNYSALEPYIDAKTMEIHFTKHASTYATNLKEAANAEGVDTGKPVEEVLMKISKYSAKMRNNGGGHYNHELFWKCMKTKSEGKPSGKLLTDIEGQFKSFGDFKIQFAEAAKNRFGSGWSWLYVDNRKLKIGSTPNQDNPLMDVAEIKGMPLLGLDIWEHAYYLKYQNKRPEYIDNWWNLVNWDFVQKRYELAVNA
ncbi:MAG: superoxide dismutase [Chitinophagaceae bacterium]